MGLFLRHRRVIGIALLCLFSTRVSGSGLAWPILRQRMAPGAQLRRQMRRYSRLLALGAPAPCGVHAASSSQTSVETAEQGMERSDTR